jgi:nucleotide-binding universal stress UspA family protein
LDYNPTAIYVKLIAAETFERWLGDDRDDSPQLPGSSPVWIVGFHVPDSVPPSDVAALLSRTFTGERDLTDGVLDVLDGGHVRGAPPPSASTSSSGPLAEGLYFVLEARNSRLIWYGPLFEGSDVSLASIDELTTDPAALAQVASMPTLVPSATPVPPTPIPWPSATIGPTPAAEPLEADDVAQAPDALRRYLQALRDGRYDAALDLYAGSMSNVYPKDWEFIQPGTSPGHILADACLRLQCDLVVQSVVAAEATGNEVRVVITLARPDGTQFKLGPCCSSEPGDGPPKVEWVYHLVRVGDQLKVRNPPIYVP